MEACLSFIITLHDKLTFPLTFGHVGPLHAKNATAHKVNSYYTLAISFPTAHFVSENALF